LCLSLPIGAAKSFGSGEVPSAGIGGISDRFEIASEFEGNHSVARFGKKIAELARGVFAGARSADTSGDLLPVCHR
jgi:hypothetical protein